MYAGDETGAFVVDVGHFSTKAGYAGDDVPKCILPSVAVDVGEICGHDDSDTATASSAARVSSSSTSSALAAGARLASQGSFEGRRGGLRKQRFAVGEAAVDAATGSRALRGPLLDGSVQDWDALEALWRAAASELLVDMTTCPLMLTEPVALPPPQRERLTELAFESVGVPAMYALRSPVASAFAAGLPTATVVDLGYQHTRVSCVVEGYSLQRTLQQHLWGQRALDTMASAIVKDAVAGSLVHAPTAGIEFDARLPRKTARAPSSSSSASAAAGAALPDSRLLRPPDMPSDEVDDGSVAPRYSLKPGPAGGAALVPSGLGPQSHPSRHAWCLAQVGRELKEAVAHVSPIPFVPGLVEVEEEEFYLPDGARVVARDFRAALPETLFSPEVSRRLVHGGEGAVLQRMVREDGWAFGAAGSRAWGQGTDVSTDAAAKVEAGGSAAATGTASTTTASTSWAGAGGGPGGGEPGESRESGEGSVDPLHEALNGRDPASLYRFGRRMRVMLRASSTTGAVAETFPAPMPLHQSVNASIALADHDARKVLCSNILLTGGGSLLSGTADRLQSELVATLSSAFRPRVLSGLPLERQFSSWIGCSITASLGTFQQLWISKQEYAEEGAGIIERRCG